MRPATFVIDFLGDKAFKGYTQGEEWNGFACPYFTFNQGQRVMEAWLENGHKAFYSKEKDEFYFQMEDGEMDIFPSVEIAGENVYPIGNGCWIWSEAPVNH